MDLSTIDLGLKLLMSLATGIIIGIERQINIQYTHKKFGIRDFSMVSLLAFLASYLNSYNDYIWGTSFFFICIISICIFVFDFIYKKEIKSDDNTFGITTIITFPMVFLVSSLVVFDYRFWLFATLIFIILILLESKEKWHGFANTIKKNEIFDFSILIALALVITPLIPKDSYFYIPYYNINLHKLDFFTQNISGFWKIVIMVSIMSFVAHFITKHTKGKNALLLSSFFGGLVSSLATIILFLSNNKGKEVCKRNVFLGFLASGSGSVSKDIIIIFLIVKGVEDFFPVQGFLQKIMLPLAMIWVILVTSTAFIYSRTNVQEVKFAKRPLPLSFIFKFSVTLALVKVILYLLNHYFGDAMTLLASFLSGMVSSIASINAITDTFLAHNISEMLCANSIILIISGSFFSNYLFIAKNIGFKNSYMFLLPVLSVAATGFLGIYISYFS